MDSEKQNKPLVMNEKPMSAWEAAAAMGIDTRLLEYTLSLTPYERIRFHDSKLRLFLMLERRAGISVDRVKSS
jgi:hypothetical protein